MFRLWLEWDFGQEDMVFSSEADARRWMELFVDPEEVEFASHEEIFDEGMASIQELTLWVDPAKAIC